MKAVEVVLKKVIEAMEENQSLIWQKGWGGMAGQISIQGRPYQGFNAMITGFMARSYGYKSNVWVSQHALKKAGGWVRKGECFTSVLYPVVKEYEVDGQIVKKFVGWGYHNVCNLDQVANMGDLKTPKAPEVTPPNPTLISDLVDQQGVQVGYGAPAYYPASDHITMPAVSEFVNVAEYWATLAHELGHWTGPRMKRDTSMAVSPYSLDELVAELFAVQLCSMAGIEPTIDNSAAYVQGWLSKLKNDPAMLHQAAGLANKAVLWITGEGDNDN